MASGGGWYRKMRILHNAKPIDIEWLKKKFFLELVSGCNHLDGVKKMEKFMQYFGMIPNWRGLFYTIKHLPVDVVHCPLLVVRLYRTGVVNNI
jgi:hypothetical protein